MKTYHLLPQESGWTLTLEGFDDPIEDYPDHTKEEAMELAVEVASASEDPAAIRVHHEDGSFDEERTFHVTAELTKAEA